MFYFFPFFSQDSDATKILSRENLMISPCGCCLDSFLCRFTFLAYTGKSFSILIKPCKSPLLNHSQIPFLFYWIPMLLLYACITVLFYSVGIRNRDQTAFSPILSILKHYNTNTTKNERLWKNTVPKIFKVNRIMQAICLPHIAEILSAVSPFCLSKAKKLWSLSLKK